MIKDFFSTDNRLNPKIFEVLSHVIKHEIEQEET